MPLSSPVIVIPGAIAAYLRDLYPIPSEIIWSVLKTDYARASLHPDELTTKTAAKQRAYEAAEPARVVPDQIYEIAYKEMIEELRHDLPEKADLPVPVFSFGYDWRQPLEAIEAELAGFIQEVIGRTSLLRHYYKAGYAKNPKVNIVAHSMGGLIVAGCIAKFGAALKLDKVVTLGSPFQGSFEAIVKVATGIANLGSDPPSAREREAARLTPSLYHLLPSFKAGLTIDPGLPRTSLFNPALWQPSITGTIAEYIRLHGRETMNATARQKMADGILAAMLAAASDHRKVLDTLVLANSGFAADRWLCIVGVNADTRVKMEVGKEGQSPAFVFRTTDRANHWSDFGGDPARVTGDGTVPFEGAIPKFLPYESLVCVKPEDFETFEVGDKALLHVAGFHGMLPNMNMLQRLIARFFTNGEDRYNNTWGMPPPGVQKAAWRPPIDIKPPG